MAKSKKIAPPRHKMKTRYMKHKEEEKKNIAPVPDQVMTRTMAQAKKEKKEKIQLVEWKEEALTRKWTVAIDPDSCIKQDIKPAMSTLNENPAHAATERHFVIRKSKIHGLGLFTMNMLQYHEILMEYKGQVVKPKKALERQQLYNTKETYFLKLENNDCIDARQHGNCSRYMNHKCSPNCESIEVTMDGKSQVVIRAIRQILPGEELTINYSLTSDELVPCNCGARKCRRYMNCKKNIIEINRRLNAAKIKVAKKAKKFSKK